MELQQHITATEMMESLSPFHGRIKDFIFNGLREEYPYMKIEAAHEAAKASVETLHQKIQAQQLAMHQAKQRSGFMSLSTELRLRIYEFALQPQEDGDGGINGCCAIYLGIDNSTGGGFESISANRGYSMTSWVNQPALTKLNHQIRSEALPVYYSNTFVIEIGGFTLGHKNLLIRFGAADMIKRHESNRVGVTPYKVGPLQWLQRIGHKNIAMLQNLEVISETRIDAKHCLTASELAEYLSAKGFPVPQTTKFFGAHTPTSQDGMRAHLEEWWPLNHPPTTVPHAWPQPRLNGDSLAHMSVDRGAFQEEDWPDEISDGKCYCVAHGPGEQARRKPAHAEWWRN